MSDLQEFPFDFEFYNETDIPDSNFYDLAYEQVTEIAEGQEDVVGAFISLRELSGEETPNAYQARVVMYVRPNNISATEVMSSPVDALQNALDASIKQVREKREKLKNHL